MSSLQTESMHACDKFKLSNFFNLSFKTNFLAYKYCYFLIIIIMDYIHIFSFTECSIKWNELHVLIQLNSLIQLYINQELSCIFCLHFTLIFHFSSAFRSKISEKIQLKIFEFK